MLISHRHALSVGLIIILLFGYYPIFYDSKKSKTKFLKHLVRSRAIQFWVDALLDS